MTVTTSVERDSSRTFDASELRVTRIRALKGPNYWRLSPVIACDVHLGDLETVTSADIPGFTRRLIAYLPTLREHPCSKGEAGGFLERLNEGTHLPHILEHVALELQTLAGSDVSFGRVVQSGDPGVRWVIVEYEEEDVGVECMRQAISILCSCISGDELDIEQLTEDLRGLYEDVRLGPSTAAIVEEARRRGIPVRRLNSRSLVQLGLGRNLRRIQASVTDHTSSIAVEIAQDKDETKRVLSAVGLPVPEGEVARTLEGALEIAGELGYPVILKPIDASHGRGISGRLDSPEALRAAWAAAQAMSSKVIVEHFHEGADHRVLVVNGKVVACAERVPAHVVGDGRSTVRQLIDAANRDPRRGHGHRNVLTKLPDDSLTAEFLARVNYSFDTVPPAGERVLLRGTANLSTGGTSIDRTEEMHPDNITACEMAAGMVGLDIAGIDVLTPDISIPFRRDGAVILEVNAGPGLRMHTHPAEGKPRNVAAPIVDMLYPPGSETTIPIIAVTGTNGKTTTVRLIAHLFRNNGHRVGFTTTDGVYVQNRLVMEGDMTGPFAANIILSNPTLDVAVLETARGGILRAGLGFEECDVGVVLNVTADHLGLRGIQTLEQMADVKSVVAMVVRREGHAVLNGDDPLVRDMKPKTMADVVFFTTDTTNPHVKKHVQRGGIAACVDDGQFLIRKGRLAIPIAAEREVPLMVGGAARFQRQNILSAIATAFVQGMRYDDIRAGLLSFFPSPSLTPGRLNVIRLSSGARVIIDYAHNAAAIEGLVEFVSLMPAGKRIGIVTVPGDRRDEDLRKAGELCAKFDHVILKEDKDTRGRDAGEIAGIMREGALAGGLAESRIEVILDEQEAVQRGLALVTGDDVLVILADQIPLTLAAVQEHAVREQLGS